MVPVTGHRVFGIIGGWLGTSPGLGFDGRVQGAIRRESTFGNYQLTAANTAGALSGPLHRVTSMGDVPADGNTVVSPDGAGGRPHPSWCVMSWPLRHGPHLRPP